jgi:regulatory protein
MPGAAGPHGIIPTVFSKSRKLAGEELFNYAVSLLSARGLSTGELRTKLQRRAADPADVERSLTRLREYYVLDDAKFAEGYATARRDSGAFGKMRVMRDLRQRRVSATVAEKAVTEAFEDVDEAAAIKQWLERKYRNVTLAEYLKDEKHLSSAYRKLRYAGFSSGGAIRALKLYASRADDLEDTPEE